MNMYPDDDERERLLDSWQDSSQGWGRQADALRVAAMPVSIWMLDHAELRAGLDVLELAAGPGDTGFMAAQQIAPGGTLICSDAVAGMIEVARERALEQSVENIEFKQLQLEWIDLETATVDVVLIKWAVMLLLDPAAALRECRRVVRPGGRLSLAVWDSADANPWATIPQTALMELGHVEPPAPGAPGMFALAQAGRMQELLEDAGFFDVLVEQIRFTRSYGSVTAWMGESVDLSRSFREAWMGLNDEERRTLRARITELAAPYMDTQGGLVLPAVSLGAAASA